MSTEDLHTQIARTSHLQDVSTHRSENGRGVGDLIGRQRSSVGAFGRLLRTIHVDKTVRDEYVELPLHLLVLDILNGKYAVQDKADVFAAASQEQLNAQGPVSGLTPLHLAVREPIDNAERMQRVRGIVQLLTNVGCNVGIPDLLGRHPLHTACGRGDAILTGILLEAGADFKALTHENQTVVHIAARYDQDELLKGLLHYSRAIHEEWNGEAVVEGSPLLEIRPVTCSPSVIALRDGRDENNMTPLHVAAFYGMPHAARCLLDIGADPGLRDGKNRTALDLMLQEMPFVVSMDWHPLPNGLLYFRALTLILLSL